VRKRTKRKMWNLVDPIAHAIAGAGITTRDALDKLRLAEYAALDAMIRGYGTVQDWKTLTDVLNLSETMARGGVGPEVLPYCATAQESLKKAALRYQNTMRMGLDGQGITALRNLIEYADLQQSSISRNELEKWIVLTRAHLVNKIKDVVELV
jgi:hypothetical protein